jgi:hypothetical protein
MALKLFISPQELTQKTVIGGNVDIDNYNFAIENTMLSVIEPLLGTELYDKISSEWTADTLSGDYLTLFTEFVQPITKFQSAAEYIEVSSYKLTNKGLLKTASENSENVDKEETVYLSQKYRGLAQMYVIRFEKWIGLNMLSEYKSSQDEVNAQKVALPWGWDLEDSGSSGSSSISNGGAGDFLELD